MPNEARLLLEGAIYHIMARGNRKQGVFAEKADYEEYLKHLIRYKRSYRFKLYAFCLMPNHIHIMGEVAKKEDLSKFMHDLNRSYAVYFNSKYEFVGHLWQGRFKSKVILKDEYAVGCMNYIELNPVRANISRGPQDYSWSSYNERVLEMDTGNGILDTLIL